MSDIYDAGSIPESRYRDLATVAASQYGVFSRTQALAAGVGPRLADRRVADGSWTRLYPGVYRLAGTPESWRQDLLAACLAWGDGAVASHRAAAALRELAGLDAPIIELIVPRGRQRALPHLVHRPHSLPPADVTTVDGIPVTTVARTLLDLAGCVGSEALEIALDDALRRRLVPLGTLRRRLADERGPGRAGLAVLRQIVRARASTRAVPQSVFETRVLGVIRRARLPLPALQHRVRTPRGVAILDLAYVAERVAIEADGFRWHSSRRQWDHDRARRNALAVLGWTVIHVTWPQLRDEPEAFVQTVAAALARAR